MTQSIPLQVTATHEQTITELNYHRGQIQDKQDQIANLQFELVYHHQQVTLWAGQLAMAKG